MTAMLSQPSVLPEGLRGQWYWGPPGCGKSFKAYTEYPTAFRKAQNKWWDGYVGQSVVILDDLDLLGGQTLGHYLKIWADRYPCTGEIKGGTINLRHDVFLVTSNYLPEDLWPGDLQLVEAIRRRFKITEIIKL